MAKLTEVQCKNAKPKEKSYKLFDARGLYLEISVKGSKLWRMKYYYFGKEKRLALGQYPYVSLKEAREKCDKAKRLLAENKDPVEEKRKIKEQVMIDEANTFEITAREWHAHKAHEWRDQHAHTVLHRLEKDVFPIIGKVPIKKLTHKHLLDMAKTIQERGANELAKRVIQMSRHIFQYAIITGRADRNIAEDLRGLI